MESDKAADVAQILAAATAGDRSAIDEIYAILYPELRALAHRRVRGSHNAVVLDTTSLVHESYLRFAKASSIAVQNRKQFLAWRGASKAMPLNSPIRSRCAHPWRTNLAPWTRPKGITTTLLGGTCKTKIFNKS